MTGPAITARVWIKPGEDLILFTQAVPFHHQCPCCSEVSASELSPVECLNHKHQRESTSASARALAVPLFSATLDTIQAHPLCYGTVE
eukprot:489398-Amphidinium_carterae.1